jgi:ABC-2 type transport system ATP-binding protein
MSDGLIVAEGTPDTLGNRSDRGAVVSFRLPAGAPTDLPTPFSEEQGPAFVVSVEDPTRDLHVLTSWATSRGVSLEGLTVSKPTLEDVYLELTGETADD